MLHHLLKQQQNKWVCPQTKQKEKAKQKTQTFLPAKQRVLKKSLRNR